MTAPATTDLSPARLTEMYRVMLTERLLSERHGKWSREHGFQTTGARLGAEAIPTGVCYALRRRPDIGPDAPVDLVPGVYGRLQMGCTLELLFAEVLGRTAGYCKGNGGSNHFISVEHGLMGTGGIVGAPIPQATGMAWAAKQMGTGQVVACFFGEGASNTGMFHEGINLAAVHKVPAVFVCVNNGYAISTPSYQTTAVDLVSKRAAAYNIPGETVDGTDVLAIHSAMSKAVERARAGEGPTLLECKFWRWGGYGPGDDQAYRSKEELDWVRTNDPVTKFQHLLEERGVLAAGQADQLSAEIVEQIEKALQWALEQPAAGPEQLFQYVYA